MGNESSGRMDTQTPPKPVYQEGLNGLGGERAIWPFGLWTPPHRQDIINPAIQSQRRIPHSDSESYNQKPTNADCGFIAMPDLLPYFPALSAMLVLMVVSAIFSSTEAAYFSLSQADWRHLAEKNSVGRLAYTLSRNPEQLLNCILLGNLVVNLLTFTISTIVMFQLQSAGHTQLAGTIGMGSLFGVILFCEVLPKNIGVLVPRFCVLLETVPLALIVRLLQPILPLLQKINILMRRLLCPQLAEEPYLRVRDLERAVEMSRDDVSLLKREQLVLQNIVAISDARAEELMRPRSLIKTFHPPITFHEVLDSLQGKLPRSGYCLLTESDSEEIASALSLIRLSGQSVVADSEEKWQKLFQPLIFVPWSASVADVFDRLQRSGLRVAGVLNEFGETIGILTMDDIIETLFTRVQDRSRRLLDRMELRRLDTNLWQANRLTSLRRLRRKFGVSFADYSSLTVGGMLQEIFGRLPRKGDVCQVGRLEFRVGDAEEAGDEWLVQLRMWENRDDVETPQANL